jgi:hypothetical protein
MAAWVVDKGLRMTDAEPQKIASMRPSTRGADVAVNRSCGTVVAAVAAGGNNMPRHLVLAKYRERSELELESSVDSYCRNAVAGGSGSVDVMRDKTQRKTGSAADGYG